MSRHLNYDSVAATRPAEASWAATPGTYRRYEQTVRIGQGDDHWEFARREVLGWGIKTRSGFSVTAAGSRVRVDSDHTLVAHIGPMRVHEPVRVVAVVDDADRAGFAYGTLQGHPVSGEEAFIVHRSADGTVWLTLRSLTSPGRGRWRLAYPAVLLAQRVYRRRYLKALLQ